MSKTTTELTQEEKRIKIAEACSAGYRKEIPDYFRSLDACHEMENTLQDWDYCRFVDILKARYLEITKGCTSDGAYSAPASERAEAFGKTLNLWP